MTLATAAFGQDGLSYTGKDMRQLVAAVAPNNGVVDTNDFLVAAQGSPNATVAVAAGRMIVPATGAGLFGSYEVWNDASINSAAFDPTGGDGRWDYLIVRVTAGVPALEIVQGTPAGSPAAPTITGDNYEPLALVKLPGGTTNVTNAMITDARNQVVPAATAWTTYNPVWTSSGNAPAVNNGTLLGRYVKTGRSVDFKIQLIMGTTSSGGTGALFFSLPFEAATAMEQNVLAKVYSAAAAGNWFGFALIAAGGTICTPYFPVSHTETGTGRLTNSTSGAVGQSTPLVAGNYVLTSTSNVVIGGRYESLT